MELKEDELEALKRLAKLEDRLSKIADEDAKMEWLWATVRKLAAWVTVVLGATVLMWDSLKN